MRLLFSIAICCFMTAACIAAEEWGKIARHGLQSKIETVEAPRAYGAYRFTLTLRNAGKRAIELPQADKIDAWFFVAQGRTAYFSSKSKPDPKVWPKSLESGATASIPLDLGGTTLFRFEGGMRLSNGYPKPAEGQPQKAGPTNRTLEFGRKATMSWVMLFPGNPIISMGSNKLILEIDRPDWQKLAVKDRKIILSRLVAAYLKGPTTAKDVHAKAVLIGAPALDSLIAALHSPTTKEMSKPWLIASISEIGGDKAADAIVKLLKGDKPWVGAAYHCVKISDPRIDAAILKHAKAAGNEEFAVWAIRGYVTFRKRAPAKLVQFAIKSSNLKLKNYGIIALGKNPTGDDIKQLLGFLRSGDVREQASAATALKNSKRRTKVVLGGLIEALPKAKPFAQERINDALNTLSGNRSVQAYDVEKPTRSVNYWVKWWADAKDSIGKGEVN